MNVARYVNVPSLSVAQFISCLDSATSPVKEFASGMQDAANAISNVTNTTNNRTQEINQTFNITMPNVTDSTSATAIMRDLQSLATKKLQFNWT